MRLYRLLISTCLLAGNIRAQSTIEMPGDTLLPQRAEFRMLTSLDSLHGDTIFSTSRPKCYVIHSYNSPDTVFIAIRDRKGYKVFNGCPGNDILSHAQCDTVNFNGKGNNELIIRWEYGMGRSGWIDGWNEHMSGVFLWDLDRTELLFEFQDQYEHNYWWNGVVFDDSTGELKTDSLGEIIMIDSLSGGESECDYYDLEIQLKRITIQRARCPDSEPPEESDESNRSADHGVWVYELRNNMVIRTKSQ